MEMAYSDGEGGGSADGDGKIAAICGGRNGGRHSEVIACLRLLEEDTLLSNVLDEGKNSGK